MPFQPGQSGNPGGRPKGPTLTDALRVVLEEANRRGVTNREQVARKLVQMAKGGHLGAIELVYTRTEGKVPERLIHQGDDEQPVVIRTITAVLTHKEETP